MRNLLMFAGLAACGGNSVGTQGGLGTDGIDVPTSSGEEGTGVGDDETDGDGGEASSGGPEENPEICDGYDNDSDGSVDEGCACEDGSVQDCFAGPPYAAIACRGTTQLCSGGGSEQAATWGECGGLCDGSTLTLQDPTVFRVNGAQAGDRFQLAARAGFGDINGDAELDFAGASAYGDTLEPDTGAGYALYGGGCLQGRTVELASTMLTGGLNDELFGGFVVDDASGSIAHPAALLSDINRDALADVVVADSPYTVGVVYGSATPAPLYDLTVADGSTTVNLTGSGGPAGNSLGIATVDFDGDGWVDIAAPASNSGIPVCPCGTQGINIWWGRETFEAVTPLDVSVAIGIGYVGEASQHNFSAVGGGGDFNNDGFLDIVGGNGAANDGMVINYRTFVIYGNAARTLPASMISVAGADGFGLSGGSGRGPHPNHQHGDFNGDGVDDLIAFGATPYATASEVDVAYGGPAIPASLGVADFAAGSGVSMSSGGVLVPGGLAGGYNMGVGDVDGDGFDDLAVAVNDTEVGGVVIIWGRAGAFGAVELDLDPEVTVLAGVAGLGLTDAIAIADVDGDGLGDLLIGAPGADTGAGEDAGAGIIKFGSCLAEQHNVALMRGFDGDETLVGGPDRDTIASGRGDDTLEGGGGADALAGGQGDDRIVVPDGTFARVDGGVGTDTLVLDGAMTLDLRTIGRARIQNIERFELGEGDQVLALNQGDATALAHVIEIDGDAGDAVTLAGPWISGAAVGGYTPYRAGALTVSVDGDITVSVE